MKLTYDDFVNFPDDGKRHELIDGEHYVTPSHSAKHQAVSGNLYALLRMHLRLHPTGTVFHGPFDVVLSRFDVVEPDLLFVSQARIDILTSANVQGSPDLVVEILSPGTRRTDETTSASGRDVRRPGILGRRSRAGHDQSLSTIRGRVREGHRVER